MSSPPSPPGSDESIFAEALQRDTPIRRAAYLDQACAGKPDQRRRVEELLSASQVSGMFLERSAAEPQKAPIQAGAAPTLKMTLPQDTSPDAGVGTTIGRYKLLQKIGEGGCGTVFMAEQVEPVRRRVALKIIKLGMDTKAVIARFEAERQALAMMDHPNIAKVLDAGATDNGRPYFVMELVKGIPVTQFCNDNQFDTLQRLELFIKMCSAVQHAHQKGIIHRDLKPSNILVTLDGNEAVPKVIDFGIAKATEGRLTDRTLFTAFEQFVGTPAYMSPEQAQMSCLDIDTRSDIYSLGVLLYEILTGKPPFDPETLLQAGLDEMRRIVREVEPPRPSTRLSTLAAAELTAVARQRRVDPKKLGLLVRGDLDWIVMKALEKDRSRRYESASGLAEDLQNFLRHEPIKAVAPTAGYRLGKFIRRNRTAVVMALTVIGLLLGGVATSTWLAMTATRARQLASREAQRAAQVARLLKEMLEGVRPARARGQDTVMLRGILDQTAARVGSDLRDQPDVEFEMRGTMGRTYEALGAVEAAESMQRAALALARRHYGDNHTNTALAVADLAYTLRLRGQFNEATNLFHESLAILRRQVSDSHPDIAGPLHRLGNVYCDLGKFAEASPLLTRAVEIRRRSLGPDDRQTLVAELDLATLFYRQGRLADAALLTDRVVEAGQRVLGEDDSATLNAMALLAGLRQEQGRFSDSEVIHLRLLEIKRRMFGPEHQLTLTSMDNLAVVYGFQGRYPQAEALCRTAIEGFRQRVGPEHRYTLAAQSNLAEYHRNQRRFQEAEALFQQVMEVQRRTMAADDPYRLETENSLGVLYFMQGRYTNAAPLWQNILNRRRASLSADDPALGDALAQVTLLLLNLRKFSEAEPLAVQCLTIQTKSRPGDWRQFTAQSQLGGCLLGLGRLSPAEPLLVQAGDGLKQREASIPMIDRARVLEACERLVQLYEATGRPNEAAQWRQELDQRRDTEAKPSPLPNARGRP